MSHRDSADIPDVSLTANDVDVYRIEPVEVVGAGLTDRVREHVSRAGDGTSIAEKAGKTALASKAVTKATGVAGGAGDAASSALKAVAASKALKTVAETASSGLSTLTESLSDTDGLRERAGELGKKAAEIGTVAVVRSSALRDVVAERGSGLLETAGDKAGSLAGTVSKAGAGLVAVKSAGSAASAKDTAQNLAGDTAELGRRAAKKAAKNAAKQAAKAKAAKKAVSSASDAASSVVKSRLDEHADKSEAKDKAKEKAKDKAEKAKRRKKRSRRIRLIFNLLVIAGAGAAAYRAIRQAGESSGSPAIGGAGSGGTAGTPTPDRSRSGSEGQPGPYVNEAVQPAVVNDANPVDLATAEGQDAGGGDPVELANPETPATPAASAGGAGTRTPIGDVTASDLTAQIPPAEPANEPNAEIIDAGSKTTQPRHASFEAEDAPQRVDPPEQGE